MDKSEVKIEYKLSLFYRFMIFKIRFQALFNLGLAWDTYFWVKEDIKKNPFKYVRILKIN